jgi:hypothetical protein
VAPHHLIWKTKCHKARNLQFWRLYEGLQLIVVYTCLYHQFWWKAEAFCMFLLGLPDDTMENITSTVRWKPLNFGGCGISLCLSSFGRHGWNRLANTLGDLWDLGGFLVSSDEWEFQDPKMEVLYHISGHIYWGYSLT